MGSTITEQWVLWKADCSFRKSVHEEPPEVGADTLRKDAALVSRARVVRTFSSEFGEVSARF